MAQHFGKINFKELLPSVLQSDEGMKNAADAINPELKKSGWSIPQILLMSRLALASNKTQDDIGILAPFRRLCESRGIDLEKLNETELDLLAWQFHVDQYTAARSIDRRRDMVANTIKRHRVKGTKGAVKGILEDVFGECEPNIVEWFENGDEPYHFTVTMVVPDGGLDGDTIKRILELVTEYKNVRSWCSVFATTKNQNNCNEYIAFASSCRTLATIALGQKSEEEYPTDEYFGMAVAGGRTDTTVFMGQPSENPTIRLNEYVGTTAVTFTKAKIMWRGNNE